MAVAKRLVEHFFDLALAANEFVAGNGRNVGQSFERLYLFRLALMYGRLKIFEESFRSVKKLIARIIEQNKNDEDTFSPDEGTFFSSVLLNSDSENEQFNFT